MVHCYADEFTIYLYEGGWIRVNDSHCLIFMGSGIWQLVIKSREIGARSEFMG